MSKPPELWAFLIANALLFISSGVLALLSYIAYRQRNRQKSYLMTTIGFSLVVIGGLVEPTYQLVVRGDYNLNGTELLWLQSGEGILIAAGLALIFYAITYYDTGGSSTEKDTYKFGPQETDK